MMSIPRVRRLSRLSAGLALSLVLLAPTLSAQQPSVAARDAAAATTATKAPLTIADYARWRSIQSPQISADGQWVAWVYTQLRQPDQLHVKHVDSGREHVVPLGSRPVFSDDSRWIAYSTEPPVADVEKLEKDNKPVPRRAEIMNLDTGEKTGWANMTSFAFNKASTHLVAKRARAQPAPKHDGTDLVLHNLGTGASELIGSVDDFAFDKPGTFLAYTVDAADRVGNGLYLGELPTGIRRPLDTSDARYSNLTWAEEGGALAALRGTDDEKLERRTNVLLVARSVGAGATAPIITVNPETAGVPAGFVISESEDLGWNDAADRVFFGIIAQRQKPTKYDDAWLKPSMVDVFHWNDDRLQSVQKVRANQDRDETDLAVFHLATSEIVRLQDETLPDIEVTRDGRWAIGSDDRAFVSDWEESRANFYRVDVETGARTPILEAHGRTLGVSPDSSRMLYWKDGHVWAHELATDRHVNLTARAPVSFVDAEFDRYGEKPPYGVAGWTRDGRGVVLEHRYDLWFVPFDGSDARNLTNGVGARDEIVFRYLETDPEARFIDLSQPLLLSTYGQWTKRSGFSELREGRLRELTYSDARFGRPTKALHADRYLLTRESWTDFPDLHVVVGDFAQPTRITDANPQQAEYAWGRRILFDFENADGVRLQGTLAIPDGYQPGERLPMLVNFYEKNSQNLHRHAAPRYTSAPQFAAYVSNGYLVMQPDIHFRIGSSHTDMLECVEAAVAKVVEMGYADPDRVGLHGHSYSGGGSSFIATRSTAFAAIVAGAAPINLVSEFNILFRGSGQNNHRYDIHGQGRYASNPFDDFDLYWDQSPISGVRSMDTPLLYMHGAEDPTVEYLQGMEFYNALRFNKKPVIFLSYPGEGHSLRQLPNQLDYLTRMEQFYGHYLKGQPPAAWMTYGEPFLSKDQRAPATINVKPPGGGKQ